MTEAERALLLATAAAVAQIAHIVGTTDHHEAVTAALADMDKPKDEQPVEATGFAKLNEVEQGADGDEQRE